MAHSARGRRGGEGEVGEEGGMQILAICLTLNAHKYRYRKLPQIKSRNLPESSPK